jgi:hypothetical protein
MRWPARRWLDARVPSTQSPARNKKVFIKEALINFFCRADFGPPALLEQGNGRLKPALQGIIHGNDELRGS